MAVEKVTCICQNSKEQKTIFQAAFVEDLMYSGRKGNNKRL
jgi:hypothetical protein